MFIPSVAGALAVTPTSPLVLLLPRTALAGASSHVLVNYMRRASRVIWQQTVPRSLLLLLLLLLLLVENVAEWKGEGACALVASEARTVPNRNLQSVVGRVLLSALGEIHGRCARRQRVRPARSRL